MLVVMRKADGCSHNKKKSQYITFKFLKSKTVLKVLFALFVTNQY